MKKVLKIGGIALAALVVLAAALGYGLARYGEWKFNDDIKKLEAEANRPYLEDTYGGKTPQETLQLFITAVEKEDFELASKYFILSRQEEWERGLKLVKEKNNLAVLLENLKKMEDGEYLNSDNFQMAAKNENGVYEAYVSFIKYPNGNWKIKEI